MVGVAGFEPAASCSQGTRANQAALHPVSISYNLETAKAQAVLLDGLLPHMRKAFRRSS